jgi:hypothetical protein
MRNTAELVLEGLHYKLRIIMGVPIDGPTFLFCNNEPVVTNSTAPELTLKKKYNSLAAPEVQSWCHGNRDDSKIKWC